MYSVDILYKQLTFQFDNTVIVILVPSQIIIFTELKKRTHNRNKRIHSFIEPEELYDRHLVLVAVKLIIATDAEG